MRLPLKGSISFCRVSLGDQGSYKGSIRDLKGPGTVSYSRYSIGIWTPRVYTILVLRTFGISLSRKI